MLKPEHAVENDSLSGKKKLGKPKHLAARRQNAHLGSWARAVPRDMAFRSAGIACPSLRLRAVLGDVARSTAIVAFRALNAITREMADSTACVAALATKVATTTSSAAAVSSSSATGLGARLRNVADFAALVALSVRRSATTTIATR